MRWAALAVILATAAGTNSCTSTTSEPSAPEPIYQDSNNRDWSEKHILLSDGRVVTCLEWSSGSGNTSHGGVSCDWDNAEGTE